MYSFQTKKIEEPVKDCVANPPINMTTPTHSPLDASQYVVFYDHKDVHSTLARAKDKGFDWDVAADDARTSATTSSLA